MYTNVVSIESKFVTLCKTLVIGFINRNDLDESAVSSIFNESDSKSKALKQVTPYLPQNEIKVEISDALSEKDKVKFTVQTTKYTSNLEEIKFSVVRQHEEFVWLHDRFEEEPKYIGFIIPPAPPRPDFDASREKLQKLGEGEGTMTKEEFSKMKQELEAEYLATFKKTVAVHEMFLIRLAKHPVFKFDYTFQVFLEYDEDLLVRGKNKLEKIGSFMNSVSVTTDEYLLSAKVKDINEFFEEEKNFLIDYHNHLKDATAKADKMTRKHKDVADCYLHISAGFTQLSTIDHKDLDKFLVKVTETFEKARKLEARVASDEDLKLSDTLRFYMRELSAAKRLLYRRLRCLAEYTNANRNLEKVRTKNKDVHAAEKTQINACNLFQQMDKKAEEELLNFKDRRIADFRKNLVELAELEIKHAKSQVSLLKTCLASLKKE
ncbi:Sorting nexin-6, putative [Pediculus humanus corporis]|uniref:Sorting nexin n=1 Tax=Pediculus humanus subsp. corporis TaxID=121224 RepID=E0VY45_PEDHC|nr:Sorting nexin-6, putative [Pediculus humanus corporis]EEB18301.1 Sorting nexin-6, putative [Pediculus humanus corporis]